MIEKVTSFKDIEKEIELFDSCKNEMSNVLYRHYSKHYKLEKDMCDDLATVMLQTSFSRMPTNTTKIQKTKYKIKNIYNNIIDYYHEKKYSNSFRRIFYKKIPAMAGFLLLTYASFSFCYWLFTDYPYPRNAVVGINEYRYFPDAGFFTDYIKDTNIYIPDGMKTGLTKTIQELPDGYEFYIEIPNGIYIKGVRNNNFIQLTQDKINN